MPETRKGMILTGTLVWSPLPGAGFLSNEITHDDYVELEIELLPPEMPFATEGPQMNLSNPSGLPGEQRRYKVILQGELAHRVLDAQLPEGASLMIHARLAPDVQLDGVEWLHATEVLHLNLVTSEVNPLSTLYPFWLERFSKEIANHLGSARFQRLYQWVSRRRHRTCRSASLLRFLDSRFRAFAHVPEGPFVF